MRLVSIPCAASNVLPCQAKILINDAISALKRVPDAMIAVPSAWPLGISPAGLLENRSSSSCWDMDRSSVAAYCMGDVLDRTDASIFFVRVSAAQGEGATTLRD